jgi:hypothetical protein
MPTHAQIVAGEARVTAQLASVNHQSDTQNALDAAVRAKAGWDPVHKLWIGTDPGPVTFRMKATGKLITSGFEQAHRAVCSGVADLV